MAKQKLIDLPKFERLVMNHRGDYLFKEDVLAALARQPIVEAVEVVRCKNCHNCTKNMWCNLLMMEVKPDVFCSYGKRR